MNKEKIKEVIDDLNGVVKGIYRMDEAGLEIEDIEIILDYITNLQKENEKLNIMLQCLVNQKYEEKCKNAKIVHIDYVTKEQLQDRINKALEIIEQKRGEYDIPDELEKILKGSDKE